MAISDEAMQQIGEMLTEKLSVWHESVGLLLGRSGEAREAVRLNNVSAWDGGFAISGGEIARVEAYAAAHGLTIAALFHSHVGGDVAPSPGDIHGILLSSWPWMIVSWSGDGQLAYAVYAVGEDQTVVRTEQSTRRWPCASARRA